MMLDFRLPPAGRAPGQPFRRGQAGYVLVTALLFLLVLTLVALAVVRNAGLGARMSNNLMLRTEAFESAEAARQTAAQVLNTMAVQSAYGTELFTSGKVATPTGLTFLPTASPSDWFDNSLDGTAFTPFAASEDSATQPLTRDATFNRTMTTSGTTYRTRADLFVYRLNIEASPGDEQANVANGIRNPNTSRNLYYYLLARGYDGVNSAADDARPHEARYETASVYRLKI